MKIVYYPQNFDGPGCYRCLYPGASLSARGGHETKLGAHQFVGDKPEDQVINLHLDTKLEADLVVLHLPGEPEFVIFQQALQSRGIKVVIDMDDDYLNLPDYNSASKGFTDINRYTMTWCLRHADGVTVTTPALKKSISGVTAAPIYVLRNYLDWKVWKHVPPVYENRPWEKLRIGYNGAARWHGGDLELLKPWLGKWLQQHPDVELVGNDPHLHDYVGTPKGQALVTDAFVFRHQGVARHLATMDIGLVPLVRNRFNEAKSHLKGMEYAGVGIPCLASPTESYRDWWLAGGSAGDGGAGYLCDRPKQWISALDRLYEDRQLLVEMGRKARELAEQNTYQDHWRLWETTYAEILGSGGDPARRDPDPSGAVAVS